MAKAKGDLKVIRDLAKQYAEVASREVMEERRGLWSRHNSLKPTRPLVLVNFGMWNVWCREVFSDSAMKCADPFLRDHERGLRMKLFHATLDDDFVFEPWIEQGATFVEPDSWEWCWGLAQKRIAPSYDGGASRYEAPLGDLADVGRLSSPHHRVDEKATADRVERLREAVGDVIEVDAHRGPALASWHADVSYDLARLRGLEQMMIDMVENPEGLHRLLRHMSDSILRVQDEAEEAGDFSLTTQHNQAMTYADELERPKANSGPRGRKDLWTFFAAQEFTLVSPAMHEEFLLRYQIPIMAKYGLAAYGCCEDLTRKIDILRKVPNLRRIAVTPIADVKKCAEQIRDDYVISWRPSPADMVSYGFDEKRIRKILRESLRAMKGCHVDITLKDIETVEGEPERLAKWVRMVREEIERNR